MDDDRMPLDGSVLGDAFAGAARPILTLDVEKYQAYLDGADLSEAQKEEFIRTLWSIVVSFVELGFGVHPLQEVCGQNGLDDAACAKAVIGALELDLRETRGEPDESGLPGGLEVT